MTLPAERSARDALALQLAHLAHRAAGPVMEVYAGAFTARRKADHSPVTEADERAEAVILEGLARIAPQFPVVSEEACARTAAPRHGGTCFLVDPVDGTREFLRRNGEFTINIALVEEGRPTVGVVYAPALRRMWFAAAQALALDIGADEPFPKRIDGAALRTRPANRRALGGFVSRSHGEDVTAALFAALGVVDRHSRGSSLKYCLIAEGQADLYARFGPISTWDIAAGHAVLQAASGAVLTIDGRELRYEAEETAIRGGFIAWGDRALGRSLAPVVASVARRHAGSGDRNCEGPAR